MAKDAVVAPAWAQQSFAHYSGVSRMLKACNQQTVDAVQQAVDVFSQPFISGAVHELLHADLPVIYDLDLLGQAVSSTSSSYPQAAFGWMNDSVKLGYQLARVCFSTKHKERIWLSGFHHPGDRVSATCLQELIQTAEAQTHVRPRRRTDLLVQRMVAHTQKGTTHPTATHGARGETRATATNAHAFNRPTVPCRANAQNACFYGKICTVDAAQVRQKMARTATATRAATESLSTSLSEPPEPCA